MAKPEPISLKVGELTNREEFGRGIVRVGANIMQDLGIREGDVVELEGKRNTSALAVRAYPADVGLAIIRMDGVTRRNTGVGVGETVKLKKAEIKEAKRVVVAPAQKGLRLQVNPEIIKKNLMFRPLMKGDMVTPFPVVKQRRSGSIFEELFGMEDMFFTPLPGETRLMVVSTNPSGPVRVGEMTDFELKPEAVEIETKAIPTMTYEDIGGLKPAIEKIREMVELPMRHPELFTRLGIDPPKGVLLYGPPGTGKTLLAKAVANESGANFISISGPEVMSKWYGESEKKVREIFEDAEKNAPSIIFIDEIDSIAPKREEVTGEVERRVVSQILSMMDGLKSRGKVIVIAATNRPNALDPALRRPGRFDREIEIGVPDQAGRLEVLQIHTRNMPLKDVDLKWLSDITYGFVGADLEALAKEAAMSALRRALPGISWKKLKELPSETLEKLRVTQEDFKNALKMVEPSAMREVMIEIPNVKWSDIGGLESTKGLLKEVVEWPLKHPEAFKRMGINTSTGVLLYGPPGTGKTMLAKAVANEAGANFISVSGPEVFTMWVGESERKIREIFRRAKQVAPAIIFFDEIDSIAPKRGLEAGARVTETVVSQILSEISGLEELHNVVVIAATNRPDIIDPALLRPGRFDRQILIPAPDLKAREEILDIYTKRMPFYDIRKDLIKIVKESKIDKDKKDELMTVIEYNLDEFKNVLEKSKINEEEKDKIKKAINSVVEISKKESEKIRKPIIKVLAKNTDGYSGADIESICREAGMNALRKDIKAKQVTKKHFDEAMKKIAPSISPSILEFYKQMSQRFKAPEVARKKGKDEELTYVG